MMDLYKFGRLVCRAFIKIAFNVSTTGKENLPESGNFILCSNHRTYMDPIFIGLNIKQKLTFMAKQELFEKPVLGFVIKRLGAFPVSRGKGDTGAVDTAIKSVKDGKVLAIFPEGTRSRDGELLRFKSGAALVAHKTGADIVPACICFEGKLSFRKKVIVRFGKPVSNEELGITGQMATELKNASKLLQSRVQELHSQGMTL